MVRIIKAPLRRRNQQETNNVSIELQMKVATREGSLEKLSNPLYGIMFQGL
jgi:hypothetical protein